MDIALVAITKLTYASMLTIDRLPGKRQNTRIEKDGQWIIVKNNKVLVEIISILGKLGID